MSKRHPVVAVTGSSGAGTSTVKRAFEQIFKREDITPAVVEGDSYHRFERAAMACKRSGRQGRQQLRAHGLAAQLHAARGHQVAGAVAGIEHRVHRRFQG